MELQVAKQIFETLYSNVNGYMISSMARNKLSANDKSYTYGEVIPDSFYEMVKYLEPQPGQVFFDLGSGTGKAVILSSLLFDFSKCTGIELLEDLYNSSRQVLGRFRQEVMPAFPKISDQRVEFLHEDFLHADISDGDIFFTHSTCFGEELMTKLSQKLQSIKKGAKVMTVTKTLDTNGFMLLQSKDYQLGWGKATINSYQKE